MITQFLFIFGMYVAAIFQIKSYKYVNRSWFIVVSFFIFWSAVNPIGIIFAPVMVILLVFLNFKNLKIHVKPVTFLSQLSVGLCAGYLLLGSLLVSVLIVVPYVAMLYVIYKAKASSINRLVMYLVYAASIAVTFWYLVHYQGISLLFNTPNIYDLIVAFVTGWTLFFYLFYIGIVFLAFVAGEGGVGISLLYDVLPDYIKMTHFKNVQIVFSIALVSFVALIALQFFGASFIISASFVLVCANYLDEKWLWLHK